MPQHPHQQQTQHDQIKCYKIMLNTIIPSHSYCHKIHINIKNDRTKSNTMLKKEL